MKLAQFALVFALALSSCGGVDVEKMEADRLAKMNLNGDELAIANAMVEGYKKEMNMPILQSKEYARAACYAKKVKMPARHDRVHKLYISNYTEIEKDFYPWFQRQGISDDTAYEIGQKVSAAYDACSFGNQIKERLSQ